MRRLCGRRIIKFCHNKFCKIPLAGWRSPRLGHDGGNIVLEFTDSVRIHRFEGSGRSPRALRDFCNQLFQFPLIKLASLLAMSPWLHQSHLLSISALKESLVSNQQPFITGRWAQITVKQSFEQVPRRKISEEEKCMGQWKWGQDKRVEVRNAVKESGCEEKTR